MKKVWKKFYKNLFSSEIDLRERLFRVILVCGLVILLVATVETIIVQSSLGIIMPYLVMILSVTAALYATVVLKKTTLAIWGIGMVLNIVVLPEVFLTSGGVHGGAATWLLMGILYNTLMFDGKAFIRMQFMTVCIDCILYAIAFRFPDYVKGYASESDVYLDSLFSVIMVGLCVGAVFKYQILLFHRGQGTMLHQKEEIEKLVQSKSKMFANVSHEIRTPLNSILLLDEMIIKESKDEQIRDYGKKIKNSSTVLLSLINDILDVSQIEMGKMKICEMPYNTKEMFAQIVDIINVRAQNKNLKFEVDISDSLPLVLYGDQKRMEQILLNLLTNAVKYTEVGRVTLRVDVEEDEEKEKGVRLVITVSDTGIGIRKEDLEDLYNIFQRIEENKHWRIEGSGLGLFITKQLVDMLGGTITVDSIYKKGTAFTVSLYQKVVERVEEEDTYIPQRTKDGSFHTCFQAPKARILIVDDNVLNASLEAKLLEETMMQIDTAQNGEECLLLTMKKAYNVIFIDYHMNGMNGGETLEAIRKQQNGLCREARVILLTAAAREEAEKTCDKYGFDGYLEKPVQGPKLEQAILSHLPESYITLMEEMLPNQHGVPQPIAKTKKRKKKVLITTDCICDISQENAEKMQIKILYLYIKTEHGRFRDTKEIGADYIEEYLSASGSTAWVNSASVEEFEEFFSEALEEAENVIHISMAKNAGKSYENATNAARSFAHVDVIESGQITAGEGVMVFCAANDVAMGMSKEEVLKHMEYLKTRIDNTIIMKDVHGLVRSEKISVRGSKLLELSGVHPVFSMKHSAMKLHKIYRGDLHSAWNKSIRQKMLFRRKISNKLLVISYVGCTKEEVEDLKSKIIKLFPFENVVLQKASFSCACIAGNRSIAFSFIKNLQDETVE